MEAGEELRNAARDEEALRKLQEQYEQLYQQLYQDELSELAQMREEGSVGEREWRRYNLETHYYRAMWLMKLGLADPVDGPNRLKMLSEARDLFEALLNEAASLRWQRAAEYIRNYLADIDMEIGSDPDHIEQMLKTGLDAVSNWNDLRRMAYYHRSLGQLLLRRGNRDAYNRAVPNLTKARDLFRSLGMHEADEVQQLQARAADKLSTTGDYAEVAIIAGAPRSVRVDMARRNGFGATGSKGSKGHAGLAERSRWNTGLTPIVAGS